MKKYSLCCILIFVLQYTSNAQLDSLWAKVNQGIRDDTLEYVDTQLALSTSIFKENRRQSDSLLNAAYLLVTHRIGSVQLFQVKYKKAKRLGLRNPKKEKQLISLDSIAKAWNLDLNKQINVKQTLANLYNNLRKHTQSIEIYNEAITIAEANNNVPKLSSLYLNISSPYIFEEDYYSAMDYLLKGLQLPEKYHPKYYQALPNICRKIEDWDNMIIYAEKGLEQALKTGDQKREIFAYMQKSYALSHLGKHGEAIPIAQKGLRKSKELKFYQRINILMNTIIESEYLSGNFDKAITYKDSLSFAKTNIKLPSIYSNMGLSYLALDNPREAIKYGNKALDVMDGKNYQDYDKALYKYEAYTCLQKAYDQVGDIKNAYEASKELAIAKEAVEGKSIFLNISRALNKQDLFQQEKFLVLEQEKKEAVLNEKISRYKLGGVLGLLLLGLGLFTIFALRKRNNKINAQNSIISQALKDKDTLLREIHHRVKNNLQLVSSLLTLQGHSITDDVAQKAIQEGKSRVRSMALIHQDLYNRENLTGIGVKEYLEKLSKELFDTYRLQSKNIELVLDVDDIELDVDVMIPMGLIINELLTNSLKYAFEDQENGQIAITLKKSPDNFFLEIKDDGSGFDPSTIRENSFGTTLIDALTQQIDGTLSRIANDGTIIRIEFQA